MTILNYKDFKEIIGHSKLPIESKIYVIEWDISRLFYRFWCKITGGKFEIKKVEKQNACFLITKRGFHPISNVIARFKPSSINDASVHEVYLRNCSGNKWGGNRIMHCYGFPKNWLNSHKCEDCGKPCAIQEDDTKIVGKF